MHYITSHESPLMIPRTHVAVAAVYSPWRWRPPPLHRGRQIGSEPLRLLLSDKNSLQGGNKLVK